MAGKVVNFAEQKDEREETKYDIAAKLNQRFIQERSFGLEIGAKSLATVISDKIPDDIKGVKVADCRRILTEIKEMCEQIKPKSETLEELNKVKQELIKKLDPEIAKKVYEAVDNGKDSQEEVVNE